MKIDNQTNNRLLTAEEHRDRLAKSVGALLGNQPTEYHAWNNEDHSDGTPCDQSNH